MTAGIDGSAANIAGGVFIEQNMFGASTVDGTGAGGVVLVPVDNYSATLAQLVENYRATADITTVSGGALITLIN